MKIVLAPDSFKGSLPAPLAAQAMADGLRRVWPNAEMILLPVADGGEGTLDTLVAATGGEFFRQKVSSPLSGEPIDALWGFLSDGETAVVELAEAAGLSLVPLHCRDPKVTHTRGVGELIRFASNYPQTKRLIIGLGGSATNDGGSGLLHAMGIRFLDAEGQLLEAGGAALARLEHLADAEETRRGLTDVDILIACDVDNPLCGVRGASAVFGGQKGATSADIALLDSALARYADILARHNNGDDVSEIPGSGAAGGTAAALLWLFGERAKLRPGIEIVLDAVGFDAALQDADLVITGEGRLDAQTFGGKVVAGVAHRATKQNVPVAALVGSLAAEATGAALTQMGIMAAQSIIPLPCTLDMAVTNAPLWLADAAERAARWMALGQRLCRD